MKIQVNKRKIRELFGIGVALVLIVEGSALYHKRKNKETTKEIVNDQNTYIDIGDINYADYYILNSKTIDGVREYYYTAYYSAIKEVKKEVEPIYTLPEGYRLIETPYGVKLGVKENEKGIESYVAPNYINSMPGYTLVSKDGKMVGIRTYKYKFFETEEVKELPDGNYKMVDGRLYPQKSDKYLVVPEGFHLENNVIVKNPDGLVAIDYSVGDNYHLEPYIYNPNLFWVVENGYHMEDNNLVLDEDVEKIKVLK